MKLDVPKNVFENETMHKRESTSEFLLFMLAVSQNLNKISRQSEFEQYPCYCNAAEGEINLYTWMRKLTYYLIVNGTSITNLLNPKSPIK